MHVVRSCAFDVAGFARFVAVRRRQRQHFFLNPVRDKPSSPREKEMTFWRHNNFADHSKARCSESSSAGCQPAVAPTGSRQCVLRLTAGGLPIRDTADCQSALPDFTRQKGCLILNSAPSVFSSSRSSAFMGIPSARRRRSVSCSISPGTKMRSTPAAAGQQCIR